MTEDRDILTFLPTSGVEHAFLGVNRVGAIRERAGGGAEWKFDLDQPADWRAADNTGRARAALMHRVADWYEAAHTRLAPGQGERLAAQARS